MMLPLLRYKNSLKGYDITSFGGINTSYTQKTNELLEAVNMSSALYPALSTEKDFELLRGTEDIILAGGYYDGLYTIERENAQSGKLFLCHGDTKREYATFASEEEAARERHMEFMNDNILILPDKILYDIKNDEFRVEDAFQEVTKEICMQKFAEESQSDNSLPNPYDSWYSSYITSNSLVSHKGTYKIHSIPYDFYHMSLGSEFREGDFVKLRMNVFPIDATYDSAYREYVKRMEEGIVLKIKELVYTTHNLRDGTIKEVTSVIFEDGAMDMGGYDEVFVYDLSVEKVIPDFVDTCTYQNRMWGVTEREIRSSSLGQSAIWEDFTVDSYGTLPSSCFKTEVDSDGNFTAITAYGGNILALKEDCIYKLYGNEPNAYYLNRINCPGVKAGCKNTVKTVNGKLFYMGKNGIYSFNGTSVSLVSSVLDIEGYSAKAASGNERFYYVELVKGNDDFIFVYDTFCGIWHKIESPEQSIGIVLGDDGLYFLCQNGIYKKTAPSSNWKFVFSFGKKEFTSKQISSVCIRYFLGEGGNLSVMLKDRNGTMKLCEVSGKAEEGIQRMNLTVSCSEDSLLEFCGGGDFVLSSLSVNYRETGIKY